MNKKHALIGVLSLSLLKRIAVIIPELPLPLAIGHYLPKNKQ
jgi:hypothetical protein